LVFVISIEERLWYLYSATAFDQKSATCLIHHVVIFRLRFFKRV